MNKFIYLIIVIVIAIAFVGISIGIIFLLLDSNIINTKLANSLSRLAMGSSTVVVIQQTCYILKK